MREERKVGLGMLGGWLGGLKIIEKFICFLLINKLPFFIDFQI